MRDYITKNYTLSIDFLDYSKNNNTSISIQNKDIVYSEKDTNTAFIEASLFANGKPIDLRGYNKVVVGIKKSDGLRVQNDCVILNAISGKIEIPFTTQSLASVGVNYFDITLYKSDSELVSPKFSYRVMEAMINDDTLESSNEFGTLVMLIEKTEELLNRTNEACDRVEILEEVVTENESVRNSNEEIRKLNESNRVSSETTRKANESNRVNSETIRKESEITRVNFYNDTVLKENIRVTKEAERVTSENTRVTNETDRVKSETTRKSNEVDRVASETTRKSNETTRVNNEQARVSNEVARESEFDTLSTNMINTDTHWNTQFQDRYDNLNQEYAELVDTLDKDISIHSSSEDLLNENVTSFKVGTGKVNGVDKDYTNQMEKSLVSIDNIDGSTGKIGEHLVSRWIPSISSIDINSTNHFLSVKPLEHKDVVVKTNGDEITITSTGASNGWAFANYEVNLEEGKAYNLSVDSVVLNGGKSAVELYEGLDQLTTSHPQPWNTNDLHLRTKNINFIATKPSTKFRLHCTLDQASGEVTYKNITIKEVGDLSVLNLGLRSLKNGIKDSFKDNSVVKLVSDPVYFKDLVWTASSTNGKDPNSTHYVYYAFPENMKSPRNASDEDNFIWCNCLDTKPNDYTNSSVPDSTYPQREINCISGHPERSEVRVKINKSIAPTLSDFNNWCRSGVGAYFQYELKVPTSYTVDPSLVSNKNEHIVISGSSDISCTHKVQLNTKAQVEELQEVVQKEKKSVWKKMKELTDVKFSLSDNGYFKFPTILGGLIVQWGVHKLNFSNNYVLSDIPNFPISFDVRCFSVIGVASNNNFGAYSDVNIACSDCNRYSFRLEIKDTTETPRSDDKYCAVNWVAIGK